MPRNPVGWFEIYVQDMDRARRFYESVFQVKLEKLKVAEEVTTEVADRHSQFEMWSFPSAMDSAGASGTLVRMEGVPSGGNSTLVYFMCADCAVEAGRVAQSGGRVQREKIAIGDYGFVCLVVDTEGNMIGLHSME
jgi:hypothetical protein